MTVRVVADLPPIYRGDDWDVVQGAYGRFGGVVGNEKESGVQIAAGDDHLVLPSGVMIRAGGRAPRLFNADDVGTMLTQMNGLTEVVPDGTTILDVDVDGLGATLSAVALDDGVDLAFVVRARDVSGFTITSHVRKSPDDILQWSLPFTTDRYPFGIIRSTIPSRRRAEVISAPTTPVGAITDTLPLGTFMYDIEWVDDATGLTSTPMLGNLTVGPDRTHTP